jgi:MFS family permease
LQLSLAIAEAESGAACEMASSLCKVLRLQLKYLYRLPAVFAVPYRGIQPIVKKVRGKLMLKGTASPSIGTSKAVAGAGWALALLLGINLFNYIDRQILSATLSKIRLDTEILDPDDPDPYTKLGALTTAFLVAYMCLSPVFGRIGDTFARWIVVGFAVIAWSLATGGTGLAIGYLMLFCTRCLVGIGEAAYGPIAPAMLSDLYPVDHRGRILSWFYMAIPVGSALGFVIGSVVAETSLGWRGAFLVAVIPGIILGSLCFFMKEPPRKSQHPSNPEDASLAKQPKSVLSSYWTVLKELKLNRSFVLCSAGMTASTFVLGGVAAVMQLYLYEREARFTLDQASLNELQQSPRNRLSDGTHLVPDEVIAKLAPSISPAVMSLHELQDKLKGTQTTSGVLNPEEYKRYSSVLIDACTARGSLTNGTIGLLLGMIVVVSGIFATLLGGIAGDYLRNHGYRGAYFKVSGWGMIVAFPFFLAFLYTSMPLGWAFLFVAVFFLFFNTGPANTILANVTHSEIRATAFAINILIIHALGDAISPLIIGKVADLSSLQTAFVGVSFLIPVSGVLWIWGERYLDEDTRKAEGG